MHCREMWQFRFEVQLKRRLHSKWNVVESSFNSMRNEARLLQTIQESLLVKRLAFRSNERTEKHSSRKETKNMLSKIVQYYLITLLFYRTFTLRIAMAGPIILVRLLFCIHIS